MEIRKATGNDNVKMFTSRNKYGDIVSAIGEANGVSIIVTDIEPTDKKALLGIRMAAKRAGMTVAFGETANGGELVVAKTGAFAPKAKPSVKKKATK